MKWYQPKRTHPIRLEPLPWTGRNTWRKPLSEHKGNVVAKSQYGIKFTEDGPWFNWAKPEKQGKPFDDVSKGDSVRMEYDTWDKNDGSKGYTVYVIENLSHPQGIGPQPGAFGNLPTNEVMRTSERETKALQDDPFPPDEEFPPDGTSEPSPPAEDYGQSLWAKDRLRARTDSIACAVGIYKSCIEAGIYKEFPSPETVVKYAATLELWAKSE